MTYQITLGDQEHAALAAAATKSGAEPSLFEKAEYQVIL